MPRPPFLMRGGFILVKNRQLWYIISMSINMESIRGRNVLLKVAYDLPSLEDTDRIDSTLETLHFLLERNNRVLISTHWGRPEGQETELSTEHLIPVLQRLYKRQYKQKLEVSFLDHYKYFAQGNTRRLSRVLNLFKSPVVMLENSRFDTREQAKDASKRLELARKYTLLVDAIVDEAFPLSHREEATNMEIKELIPTTFGFGYQNEVKNLTKLKQNPSSPFVMLLGGAKLETKLPILEHLLPRVDKAILAGQAAFPFLKLSGEIDLQATEIDSNHDQLIQKLWNTYQDKLVLPVDFAYDNGQAMDIGQDTINLFTEVIDTAKTVFWNGPMGKYEDSQFAEGTKQVAAHIAKLKNAFTVIGGGDTVSNLTPARKQKVSFVSMGGGATLDFLSKE